MPPLLQNPYTISTTDPSKNNAQVSINDDDVPEIHISSVPLTFAEQNAMVMLESHIEPREALDIKYTITNGTGNFLNLSPADAVEERTATGLSFDRDDSDDPFTAIIPILTVDDASEVAGTFVITLQDDSNTDQQYTLTSDLTKLTSTTAMVEDLPIPEISFVGPVSVLEEDTATLVITTTTNPKRDLLISYTPVEIGSNYLDTAPGTDNDGNQVIRTSGTPRIETLSFTPDPNDSSMWITNIDIPTRTRDNALTANGTISVTLNNPTDDPTSIADDYTIAAPPANSADISVQDIDLPVITIAPAPLALGGRTPAMFTLSTTTKPLGPLAINYTPTNTGGNFLATMDDQGMSLGESSETRTSEPLTFSSDDDTAPFTAILEIPTVDDQNLDSGEFKVALAAVTNQYYISDMVSEHTATVMVIDVPIPELSIAYNGDANTPISEEMMASFTITANKNPHRNLPITYTPSNESGKAFLIIDPSDANFPNSGVMRTSEPLEFKGIPEGNPNPTMWTATFNLPLDDDMDDEDHGSVTVVLNAVTDDYTVSDTPSEHTQTFKVQDNDTPAIEFTGNAPEIREGKTATFTLTASILPWQEVDVRFNPEETSAGTSFLTTYTHNMEASQPVMFEQQGDRILGTFTIPTQEDTSHDDGIISVTLLEDNNINLPQDYKLTDNPAKHTATVEIDDTPTVTLSIEPHSETAIEGTGNSVKFIVTASVEPNPNPVTGVNMTITQTGDYLESTTPPTSSLTFEEVTIGEGPDSTTKWQEVIELPLRVTDSVDKPNGSATITLTDHAETVDPPYVVAGGQLGATTKTILDLRSTRNFDCPS